MNINPVFAAGFLTNDSLVPTLVFYHRRQALVLSVPAPNICRNYLQHIRGDLMTNDAITYPVFGAISWIEKNRNYVLFSNQPTKNLNTPRIAYDRFEKRFVCKYLLVIGGHEIQIDTVFSEIKSFWKWLEKVTVIEPSHIKDYVWGHQQLCILRLQNLTRKINPDTKSRFALRLLVSGYLHRYG